jgi:hypothetical protein
MHCAISLTNQKQSVVSRREFAICCAHGLCSLAYCFSHCALDFQPTHPIVILPCLRWRPLLAGFLFQAACLRSLAACRPTSGCLPAPLGSLPALPLAVCSISGYWPIPVRLLAGCSAACRCVYLCISIFNFVICSSASTFVCPLTISPYVWFNDLLI